MSRWDIFDRDNVRNTEPRSEEQHDRESNGASVAVGRGPSGEGETNSAERQHRTQDNPSRGSNRRTEYHVRDRAYSVRNSEIDAMADIGRLRAVDIKDLARFVYGGDEQRLKYDLENLRSQGLVEEKTVFRAHRSARKFVALTAEGERIVRKASGLPKNQRLYHGFVKPKELDHDADLYKVYQKAAEDVRSNGGRITRLRLDFELKESINRAKETAGRLSEEDRKRLLSTAAGAQGLRMDGAAIHLPDIQIQYETRDGRVERENLELLSQNYREEGMRSKVAAGFTIYARSGDASRIRRALNDTGLVRQVLSV